MTEKVYRSDGDEGTYGERVLDFTPFTLEYEDFTTTHGITALVQDEHGVYLVVDYPLDADCPGEGMVVKVSYSYEDAAKFYKNLTGQAAPKVGEAA